MATLTEIEQGIRAELAGQLDRALIGYVDAKVRQSAAEIEKRKSDEAWDAAALKARIEARNQIAQLATKPTADHAKDMVAQVVANLTATHDLAAMDAANALTVANEQASIARERLRAVHATIALYAGVRPADTTER